jgi:anaerobic selenocysteine-containing dehydrogenase
VPIIVFNPFRERGFERFTNPQNPVEMLLGASTPISSQYHQIIVGGDKAALMGLAKALIALDDAAAKDGGARVLDHDFIATHTEGFEAFAAAVRAANWKEIELRSGLARSAIEAAAAV